jgi:ABC-type nitrate/sulfonate/bicarbonate transport system substrate-binding protein
VVFWELGRPALRGAADAMGMAMASIFTTGGSQAMLRRCSLFVTWLAVHFAVLFATPGYALDQVSLQLKWRHQFQFAGYYAAAEKGFYREHGIEVAIREGGPGIDVGSTVALGAADFGVCTNSLLLNRDQRAKNVVLAVIFQHSAAIILTPLRTGIRSVSDLKGHTLMDAPDSDDIAAMLKQGGVDYASLPRVNHDGDPRSLLNGTADAMVAYSTNEPYILERLATPYLVFAPRAFGFDFYGDNLCTSKEQIALHPERVRAFRAASLKGWHYALAHKEEIVDLIRRRYSSQKPREALLFEAKQTELLIQPRLVPIGDQSVERWKNIADTYLDLGMVSAAEVPEGLIYIPNDGGSLWRLRGGPFAWGLLAVALAGGLGWML